MASEKELDISKDLQIKWDLSDYWNQCYLSYVVVTNLPGWGPTQLDSGP